MKATLNDVEDEDEEDEDMVERRSTETRTDRLLTRGRIARVCLRHNVGEYSPPTFRGA